jgi:hypothetical protein
MFRSDESMQSGFERACRYLAPHGASSEERAQIRAKLEKIVSECGPVIEEYPAWHPFLAESDPRNFSVGLPSYCPSFKGLDHTIYLTNGIITCPYEHAVDELTDSIEDFNRNLYCGDVAHITIEEIKDVILYSPQATPLLIRCKWYEGLEEDGTIRLRAAMGLMLERETPAWRWASFNESWETMKAQILGAPHGARSSLFVNQNTGQQMKSVWNQLVKAGLWGDKTKN